MAQNLARTTQQCSAGERCASYAALGEPARLSRGNTGALCFACQERSGAAALKSAAAKAKPASGREDKQERPAEGGHRRGQDRQSPTCAKGSCGRPAIEWQYGARVCREHAEAGRAREWQERRDMWALCCERNLRNALSAGDEALARKWSGLLDEARASLALAKAALARAAAKAEGQEKSQAPNNCL